MFNVTVVVSDGNLSASHYWLLTVLDDPSGCHTGSNGDWDYCSESCPCGVGEGDCDSDLECNAGLVCVTNVGANYGWSFGVDVCEDPSICITECVVGENRCAGDYSQACGNYDGDYCYEWPASPTDPGSTYCEFGCFEEQCSVVPTIAVKSDSLDGYLYYRNGVYYSSDSFLVRAGHYSSFGNYYWRRAVLEFDIGSVGEVESAEFFLDYFSKLIQNETCSFDLFSIESLGSSINSGDWDSLVFEVVQDNWFDETISSDISVDVTNAWNNAINAGRAYLAFRIVMDNEEDYNSTSDDCAVYFRDTGESGTDPRIEYTPLSPNGAPVIVDYSPLNNPLINEGEQQTFTVTAFDPDGDPLTVEWFVDGSLVLSDSNSYTHLTDYNSAGTYIVSVIVSDGDLNASHEWVLTVNPAPNQAPVIDSFSPLENPIIREGGRQVFSITKSDPDNDPLTVEWFLDGELVLANQDSYTYTASRDSAGVYDVNVVVSDSELSAFHHWILTVRNANMNPAPIPVPWS